MPVMVSLVIQVLHLQHRPGLIAPHHFLSSSGSDLLWWAQDLALDAPAAQQAAPHPLSLAHHQISVTPRFVLSHPCITHRNPHINGP